MSSGFVKDMIKYLPSQVVPGFVALVSIPVVTHIFPPSEYGDYSLASATVMILTTFFGWLPTSVIRYYPAYERENRLAVFHGTILRMAVITAAGVTAAYYGSLVLMRSWVSPGLWRLLMIGGMLFATTCAFNLLQYVLRSKRLPGWFSVFAVWYSAAGFGLGIALIVLLGLGIEGLLLGTILSAAFALPLLWRKALGRGVRGWFAGRIDRQSARASLTYGMPLVVSNLGAWILSLSDRYLIGLFRDNSEVGVYSLSYNIADRSVMLLATLFVMASGPLGMTIWENRGERESQRFVADVTRLYLLTCVPLVVGLSVLSRLVIGIMAGDEYAGGYVIMPYVLSGVLLVGMEQRYHAGLLYHKRTQWITVSTLAAGLVNVVLNVLFIPRYGYYAAAVTTLASYGVLLLLTVRFSRRVFIWRFPWKSLLDVSLASALMGVVIRSIEDSVRLGPVSLLILCMGAGAMVYCAVLLTLGEFSPEELRSLRRIAHDALRRIRRGRRSPAAVEPSRAEEVL